MTTTDITGMAQAAAIVLARRNEPWDPDKTSCGDILALQLYGEEAVAVVKALEPYFRAYLFESLATEISGKECTESHEDLDRELVANCAGYNSAIRYITNLVAGKAPKL